MALVIEFKRLHEGLVLLNSETGEVIQIRNGGTKGHNRYKLAISADVKWKIMREDALKEELIKQKNRRDNEPIN